MAFGEEEKEDTIMEEKKGTIKVRHSQQGH